MELKEFIENFAAQFDEVAAASLSAETEFKELDEWSSLTALSIIAMVDEECEVELTGNEIHNAKTISDLFELVKSKMV